MIIFSYFAKLAANFLQKEFFFSRNRLKKIEVAQLFMSRVSFKNLTVSKTY